MTELKTLKDIFEREFDAGELDSGECISILEEDIKQEAIKWVKFMKKRGSKPSFLWLNHFFNITEDDLK